MDSINSEETQDGDTEDRPYQPFELWIATAAGQPRRVMTCADYRFPRTAAIRRVTSRLVPDQEDPRQPVVGEVRARGDLLFKIRRLTKTTPSGRLMAGVVVDRDWQYEDSPVGRIMWEDGSVD